MTIHIKKILMVGSASSIHIRQWVVNIARQGIEIHLISQHDDLYELTAVDRCSFHRLPFLGGVGYILNIPFLLGLIKSIKPDVVNFHYATGYSAAARFVCDVPVVINAWGSDVYEFPVKSILHKTWLTFNLKSASVIASTSFDMARVIRGLSKSLKCIEITPFGVDVDKFRSVMGGEDKTIFIFGTVKSLHDKYGVDILISAFALFLAREFLDRTFSNVELHLVGDGPERVSLESLVASLGLSDSVKFFGAVPHESVPEELSNFDVYCALSRQESFGVAVIEASSCGLPVIVSDAGGLPEVVVHGQTGFITPVGDIEAICAAMQRLYHDRALRETMGKNGRDFVVKNYSWQVCTQKMLSTYKKAIES